MTAEDHAATDATTCSHGSLVLSSNTFTTMSGRKHMRKHKKMTNIMMVSRRSFLFLKNFNLDLFGLVVSNLLSLACCFRTVLKMHEYDRMMMKHGRIKPTRKMNVRGDLPSFLSTVQENVFGSKPSSPQRPASGKN